MSFDNAVIKIEIGFLENYIDISLSTNYSKKMVDNGAYDFFLKIW